MGSTSSPRVAAGTGSPRDLALRVYESMLYDIVFNALPDMLSKLIGEGGFIGTFMVISSASEHIFRVLAEQVGEGIDLRQAAQLMRMMAEVHNEYGRQLIGVKPVEVRIASDGSISIECVLDGHPDATPVVFMGLVGGFLRALGFNVKPLKSEAAARFLKPGEVGVTAKTVGDKCVVEVVGR